MPQATRSTRKQRCRPYPIIHLPEYNHIDALQYGSCWINHWRLNLHSRMWGEVTTLIQKRNLNEARAIILREYRKSIREPMLCTYGFRVPGTNEIVCCPTSGAGQYDIRVKLMYYKQAKEEYPDMCKWALSTATAYLGENFQVEKVEKQRTVLDPRPVRVNLHPQNTFFIPVGRKLK